MQVGNLFGSRDLLFSTYWPRFWRSVGGHAQNDHETKRFSEPRPIFILEPLTKPIRFSRLLQIERVSPHNPAHHRRRDTKKIQIEPRMMNRFSALRPLKT
jgi:hypothetical protein